MAPFCKVQTCTIVALMMTPGHFRVSSRRNMIRILRESDYKKYEWLLEK